MFRPLAFVAVRQEEHETAHAEPLHLARGDELIDDHLRAVREIAELRFPADERARLRRAETIFEAHHRFFREQRVDRLEWRLPVAHMTERHVARFGFLIDEHGVALREGAARGILA